MIIGLAVALIVTGCSAVNNNDAVPTARKNIEDSGLIEWSAGPELSRDDVGLEDGSDAAIYDSVDRDGPYQAKISLPDGTVLDSAVKYGAAWVEGDGDAPCRITLRHGDLSQDEAEALLLSYQEKLGLNLDEVAGWRAHSDAVVAEGDGGTRSRSLFYVGTTNGEVEPVVEAATNRGDGSSSVLVELRWC